MAQEWCAALKKYQPSSYSYIHYGSSEGMHFLDCINAEQLSPTLEKFHALIRSWRKVCDLSAFIYTFTKSVQPLQSSCKAVYSPRKKLFKEAFSNRRRNYAEIQWPLQPAPVRAVQSLSMNDSQETSGVLQRWTSLESELFINSRVNQSARELFIHYSPWVCHLCKSSLATD